jgi:hypothetical protein
MFQLNSLDSVRDAIPRDAMISLIWVIYYEILNLMSSSWRFVTLSRARKVEAAYVRARERAVQ